ncbi:MAG: hypothetical protein V4697_01680 [Patescibacteria group bacterium]
MCQKLVDFIRSEIRDFREDPTQYIQENIIYISFSIAGIIFAIAFVMVKVNN